MKKTILIAGGTGLIGQRLTQILKEKGHEVLLFSRRPDPEKNIFEWNPAAGTLDENALRRADVVINLAGAGIADKRWTAARKREIIESRVLGAKTFRIAFEKTGHRPEAYFSASAIGFYGNSGEKIMTETDPPGQDFLSKTTQLWEKAADEIAAIGIRTVKFRIGIVLSKSGGALLEILKPMRFGVASYFGDGKMWCSWIHLEDICRMFLWAIENPKIEGVFNAAAPDPIRNKDLVSLSSKILKRPALLLPAPAIFLKIFLGEMAAVVLNSTRVSANKIERAGFKFLFPEIENALKNLK